MNKKLACLVIVCAGLFSFGPTIKTGFLWDDVELIVNNPHIQGLTAENIRHSFQNDIFNGLGDEYYRPLVTLTFMLDYQLWKLNPIGYHVTNLLFHILCALLLYFLLARLFGNPQLALIAAALFAAHPLPVEQLLVVNGRTELVGFCFTLAALLTATNGTSGGKFASPIFFLLACLGKETGLAFPFFLVLIGWYQPERKVGWKWYAAYAILAVGYLLLRSKAVDTGPLLPPIKELPFFLFRDLPMILTEYLRVLLFPFDLHSHRRMSFSWPWLAASYAIVVLLLAFGFRSKSKRFWFCLGWFLIGLLPKIPILATNALMLDHWVYPSNIAILIGIATALSKINLPSRRTAAVATLVLFYAAIGWANTIGRNTDKKLFRWALTYKSSSIVRTNLGLVYYREGNYSEAERWLKEGLARNSEDAFAINGLALVYWKTDRPEDALRILDEWLERHPTHQQSLNNRALIAAGKPS